MGIYLTSTYNQNYSAINILKQDKVYTKFNWDLVELLLTSTELPIKEIKNNSPIFIENPKDYEVFKSKIYQDIAQGELDFVRDYANIFKNYIGTIKMDDAVAVLIEFWSNLQENDIANLNQIYHPVDAENTIYYPLLTSKEEKIKTFFKSEMANLRKKMNIKK